MGVSGRDFPLERQTGWEDGSYGYFGADGKKFFESMKGEAYAESYGTGDIVGCGLYHSKQELFFTKNGKYLGSLQVFCSA